MPDDIVTEAPQPGCVAGAGFVGILTQMPAADTPLTEPEQTMGRTGS